MKSATLLTGICAALVVAGCTTQTPQTPATAQSPPAKQSTNSSDAAASSGRFVVRAPDGSAQITIDTSQAPDMRDWAEHKLAPVLADWYPKICAMLPSPGYQPPTNWSVTIAPGDGVAATGGTRVTANATWFRQQLDKQAVGALLHEEVHVVQQYGGGRRNNQPGNFSNGDITNLVTLAQKLKDKSDPVSVFIAGQLTASERKALANYSGPGPKAYELRTNLVAALNRIVKGPGIYDASVFQGVTLRDSTTTLRDEKPTGAGLARLNRALLDDAYPDFVRRAANGGGRNRGGGNTGWLTEGIPDYIRWFLYEPKSKGAGVEYIQGQFESHERRGQPYEPKYTDSYRVTANFLNFVTTKYDRHIVTKLNNALRQGQYYEDIWPDNTGKTLPELGQEWLGVVHAELKQLKPKAITSIAPVKN